MIYTNIKYIHITPSYPKTREKMCDRYGREWVKHDIYTAIWLHKFKKYQY